VKAGGSRYGSRWKPIKLDMEARRGLHGSSWKSMDNGSWWKSRKHMEASGSRWRSVEVAGNSENCGKLWKAMGAPSRWTLMEDSVSL